jgi:hypothetical protein
VYKRNKDILTHLSWCFCIILICESAMTITNAIHESPITITNTVHESTITITITIYESTMTITIQTWFLVLWNKDILSIVSLCNPFIVTLLKNRLTNRKKKEVCIDLIQSCNVYMR